MTLAQRYATPVSIDTRTLRRGDLFFAIKGEVDDGHRYVEQAFAKGACAAVVKSGFEVPPALKGNEFYFVDDTIVALHAFAKQYMDGMKAQVVALTGSSGKTTTKEFIRCALAACLGEEAVIANAGNFNNFIGAPLSMLQVRKEHKAAVLEIGMNQFGEIATLTQLVRPRVGLITNIGTAHAGNVGGPEGVAKAKSELFENLGKDAIAVVNVDDPRCVREAAAKVRGRRVNFGKAPFADVRLKECESVGPDALRIVCSYRNQDVAIQVPMPGIHNGLNVAAALAVAVALELDFERAAQGIQNMRPIKGRLVYHHLPNGVTLIDDTYNANPESMEAGLNVLASHQDAKRRIAVLGQMAELGSYTMGLHRSIGALLRHKSVNMLFACGPGGVGYAEGAIAEGFDQSNIVWAESNEELAEKVQQVLKPGDAILVKGSRSTKMEKVVDRLLNT